MITGRTVEIARYQKTSMKCRVVDCDHFSSMKPPAITKFRKMLGISFSLSDQLKNGGDGRSAINDPKD
ncbi:hypothetical protein F5B18DRAFT_628265, partial [Nemania serpens]